MSMAEMTQEELVQEVLDRVLQSSTGVEDLETVTSLSGCLLYTSPSPRDA